MISILQPLLVRISENASQGETIVCRPKQYTLFQQPVYMLWNIEQWVAVYCILHIFAAELKKQMNNIDIIRVVYVYA